MSDDSEVHLYASRQAIFPRSVQGRFRNLKWGVLALAYGVYFLLPWLRWERESGPGQAVLFDLVGRKFYIFDLVVHPQDIFWLAGILMIFAYLLFFVTGIAGRVFCGYFCFQTLWTDVFIWIERLVQGERPARIRLSKQPWNGAKVFKLGLTHLLWLLVAFVTGLTFVLYWDDAPRLVVDFFTGQAPFAAYATALFLTMTTYVMAGIAREQVCTYMCPYARFQSVMFDKDTLLIAYDEERGEPRGARKKGIDSKEAGLGDCVNCGLCVQVCPTGIDIRNGLQYQCIGCAACIDICDEVMEKVNQPKGLVRYTTEHSLKGGKTHILRPRIVVYAALLMIITGALVYSVATRTPLELDILRDRNALYVENDEGQIENVYTLKVINMTNHEQTYKLSVSGLEGLQMEIQSDEITVETGGVAEVPVRLATDPGNLKTASSVVNFTIESLTTEGLSLTESGRFLGPISR